MNTVFDILKALCENPFVLFGIAIVVSSLYSLFNLIKHKFNK